MFPIFFYRSAQHHWSDKNVWLIDTNTDILPQNNKLLFSASNKKKIKIPSKEDHGCTKYSCLYKSIDILTLRLLKLYFYIADVVGWSKTHGTCSNN
jgi:hypothetical protein